MKIKAVNRQGDRRPTLTLDAENVKEERQLRSLFKELVKVQEIGIGFGVATGGYPPCGVFQLNNRHCGSLSIGIMLGQG